MLDGDRIGEETSADVNDAVADPLDAVAGAAAARLRAEVADDSAATATAAESLMHAATAAMAAGHSLRDITAAEERGQDSVRDELRGDAIKRVERTGRQMRDAETAHHAAIARAVRLGLSTREMARAAGVTHGTIRAIASRLAAGAEPADTGTADVSGASDQ